MADLPGYDAWKTTPPRLTCDRCGTDCEDDPGEGDVALCAECRCGTCQGLRDVEVEAGRYSPCPYCDGTGRAS